MSWIVVPHGYFDRQRDLFSDWFCRFNEDPDWQLMARDDAFRRFNQDLERINNETQSWDDLGGPQYVTDADGNRKMCLRFDCRKFKPEEITVKTMEDKLSVHAKHVEEGPGCKVHHEFTREFTLPKNIDPKQLKSSLLQDGVLKIEAPAPPVVKNPPKKFTIPIQHMESKEKIEQKMEKK